MKTHYIVEKNNKVLFSNFLPKKEDPISSKYVIDPQDPIFDKELSEKIHIQQINGKFFINGNPYEKASIADQTFFRQLILAKKWEQQKDQYDENLKALQK